MSLHSLVHLPIPIPKTMRILDAKVAADMGWDRPRTVVNASNEPPRGELRDSSNDDHRVSVVSFEDQDLKRLPSVRSSPSSSSGPSSKGGFPSPSVGSFPSKFSGRKREQ